MLCFRCEHRAEYLEKLSKSKYSDETIYLPRPRHECGEIDKAVSGCYMFKPVKPIVIKPREDDPRPLSLNMLSCRVERVNTEVPLQLDIHEEEGGILFNWVPRK